MSCIKGLCWAYVDFFALVTFNYVDYIFELQLKSLFILNFVSGFLKV